MSSQSQLTELNKMLLDLELSEWGLRISWFSRIQTTKWRFLCLKHLWPPIIVRTTAKETSWNKTCHPISCRAIWHPALASNTTVRLDRVSNRGLTKHLEIHRLKSRPLINRGIGRRRAGLKWFMSTRTIRSTIRTHPTSPVGTISRESCSSEVGNR